MHTTIGRHGTTFLHNGDFSGDVIIKPKHDESNSYPDTVIAFEDLIDLVSEFVLKEMISYLENASPEEILIRAKK